VNRAAGRTQPTLVAVSACDTVDSRKTYRGHSFGWRFGGDFAPQSRPSRQLTFLTECELKLWPRPVLTPMTLIAGHSRSFPMTIEVIFVDSEHHAHHLARGLLGFLVVLFKSFFLMTEIALHT
jgi:hypothetical protein